MRLSMKLVVRAAAVVAALGIGLGASATPASASDQLPPGYAWTTPYYCNLNHNLAIDVPMGNGAYLHTRAHDSGDTCAWVSSSNYATALGIKITNRNWLSSAWTYSTDYHYETPAITTHGCILAYGEAVFGATKYPKSQGAC